MTWLAVVMDVAALLLFAWFLRTLVRRPPAAVPGADSGRSTAPLLIAVSLILLSIPVLAQP
ncbi:hypothetical protein AGRA3207_001510 [Actinomadura graeca]|uniref:Uncharacterized protein n=1 Tax=Actinomadura graeca TaxID=2750812 RepID=A0ABX8QPM6_9ACTN|nr:hypothetical protein [Actinomadura graeca]QXJ20743.1 hypothetical protein AGRA3207_001510 [Actinomadura graeca]